jgi:hypothetical protein
VAVIAKSGTSETETNITKAQILSKEFSTFTETLMIEALHDITKN